MPVSSRPRPDHRRCAPPSTLESDAWASRDGCAASESESHGDLQPPKTPAETPWHGPPPTLSQPPAPRMGAAGCTEAAHTPLPPPGAHARSGPFAPHGACGDVVLARPSAAATRLQPPGSTSVSSPGASRLDAPAATHNRPGPPGRHAAGDPCPRCLVAWATRGSRAAPPAPGARLATAPPPPATCGGSSPQAARDAGDATHGPGAGARHGPPPARAGPRWPRRLPERAPGRLGPELPGHAAAIAPGPAWLVPGPVWLGAVDRRGQAPTPWPGPDPGATRPGYSGSQAPCGPT